MKDYTFNRQEVFNREDMRELMDIISDVEMLDGNHFELTNQLYGMFDGVLYDNIIYNANVNMVPITLIRRINGLVRKIVESLVEVSDEVVGSAEQGSYIYRVELINNKGYECKLFKSNCYC